MSGRAVTCRYHCSVCGGHFSSLNAADAHRHGDHGSGDRHCVEPLDDGRFAEVSESGVCSMYAEPKLGVTVWTLAEDLARARERSGGSERAAPSPNRGRESNTAREAVVV